MPRKQEQTVNFTSSSLKLGQKENLLVSFFAGKKKLMFYLIVFNRKLKATPKYPACLNVLAQPGSLVLSSLQQGKHVNMIMTLLQSKQALKKTRIKPLLSWINHTCRSIPDCEQQSKRPVMSPNGFQDLSDSISDVCINL